MKSYFLIAVVLSFMLNQPTKGFLYPLHASCEIDWTFGINCSTVNTKIVDQIKKWSGFEICGESEKCGYKLISYSSTNIKATHTTPKKHYVDDLKFTGFTESSNNCDVKGMSSSETWYAVLDYGTNYCNLHNLITGSGLDKVPGYKEMTSNSKCTEYTSANCGKY
ncbi:uncharacterized protein LOC124440637 [Xenia sp. Carnegie-2017]|uniref:uncharacterized protein LOC124440637 n=1 Tax=Xenia sp. Carnegie-2017 TaxID=2897299 RepID=UPI001F03C0E4|nr:uncharacterized protein LOC124440637 [Xenia sp. Carnegie-2017]